MPALVAIAAALGVGALVLLLVLVLLSVNGLEETLRSTNSRLDGTNNRVGTVSERVEPLAEAVPPELRRIQPDVRATRDDVDTIAGELVPSIDRTTRIIAGSVVPLTDQVKSAELPELAMTIERVARSAMRLLDDPRLGETVAALQRTFTRVEQLDLLAAADRGVRELPRLGSTLTDIDVTIRSLRDILDVSRRVQCVTLERIASIDRKTGGQFPPESAPAAQDSVKDRASSLGVITRIPHL